MDGSELLEAVQRSKATALDRLGKEKALVATTRASLERDDVLEAAASAEARARDTFEVWAAREEDETAREAFERVAATEREHYDSLVDLLGSEPGAPDPEVDPLHEYLRGLETTPERVGAGLIGRPLAAERTLLQVVNFFVNEADNTAADTVRTLRSETAATVDEGVEVLDAVCEEDSDWVLAQQTAEGAIATVYDDYAETLEELGLDPKPVC
jgi:rubrerythrin